MIGSDNIGRGRKGTLLLLLMVVMSSQLQAQELNETDTINRKRLNTVIITGSALYAGSITGLYFLWYKDYPQTTFHFVNDNNAWLQIDKLGHMTTAYYISNYSYWSLRWAGVDEKKSTLYGGLMGFAGMTALEILDGFSAGWGASYGDLIANTVGPAFFVGQQLLWQEQRLRLKFSFHYTEYAQYRPDILGSNPMERMLKDYNGQTYWLSANIHSFLKEESRFPTWINVAFGYGGKGMLGAQSNPPEYEGQPLPHYDRVRQYYLSMDIDWTRIQTNSGFLRFTFKALSLIKLPFPTLEYNKENQFVFHWLYF